jgi:regulator of PEP synthase PpsR (kinase-PPPase family)
MDLYKKRSDLLNQLDTVRPTVLTKTFVNEIDEKLRMFNEESSSMFDTLVDKLASDMNNTNEDIDIAEADLLDNM